MVKSEQDHEAGYGETVVRPESDPIVMDARNPDALLAVYQRRMATCIRCVLAGYIPEANPVFHGYASQRVMIIGQAPGPRAHATGVPWSGRSGEILREWLGRAGFPEDEWRETWYLTSLTKCFPGKATQGKGDRAPSRAEQSLCADHLEMELALVQPEIIVTLGKLAASRLIPGANRLPLTAIIGTATDVDLPHGTVTVVPLPHPSGVSRWLNDPANRALVDEGLALLARAKRSLGL